MKKKHDEYDGIMLFNVPILINTGQGRPPFPVIGVLYNTAEHSITFSLKIELYACFLLGIEALQADGGHIIDEHTWLTGTGEKINVSSNKVRWQIYQTLKDQLQYKLYEFSNPLVYTDEEVNNGLVISPSLLDRYGVSFIEALNIQKMNTNMKKMAVITEELKNIVGRKDFIKDFDVNPDNVMKYIVEREIYLKNQEKSPIKKFDEFVDKDI